MESIAQNPVATVQAGFDAISALFIAYSFSVLGAIILIIVGYVVAGIVERSIHAALGRVRGFDATLRQFFATIARYAVLALVLIMVLGQFGVQTASIIAAIGAIGLAIGLALQGTLQNIAAGIMLLVLRPLRVGEYVEVGAVAGTVEDIGLFATRLRTFDGIYKRRRNEITVGIGYDDDIDLAQKTLTDLADQDARVFRDPQPISFVSELGASAVAVTVRYWTSGDDFQTVKDHLTKTAKTTFDRLGISIPLPQQEVIYREPDKKKP